jgi:hypothetical protein
MRVKSTDHIEKCKYDQPIGCEWPLSTKDKTEGNNQHPIDSYHDHDWERKILGWDQVGHDQSYAAPNESVPECRGDRVDYAGGTKNDGCRDSKDKEKDQFRKSETKHWTFLGWRVKVGKIP